MTEDDFKEFKVLEFIEVEPDKLVWNDAGTGTWMSGPPVCIFDQNHTFLKNIGPKSRIYLFGRVR